MGIRSARAGEATRNTPTHGTLRRATAGASEPTAFKGGGTAAGNSLTCTSRVPATVQKGEVNVWPPKQRQRSGPSTGLGYHISKRPSGGARSADFIMWAARDSVSCGLLYVPQTLPGLRPNGGQSDPHVSAHSRQHPQLTGVLLHRHGPTSQRSARPSSHRWWQQQPACHCDMPS